jgi:hypothetical protein
MKKIAQTSFILGISAAIATAGSPAITTGNAAATPTPCEWRVVAAKNDTLWTNLLEGGPIRALAAAVTHSKPNRNFVCANPGVDWSKFGQVEIDSIMVTSANLKKPLNERQMERLRAALAKALNTQFGSPVHNGETSLRVRANITEVRRTNALLNVVTLAAIQVPVSFGGATTHFELTDGSNGVKVADVTLRGSGRLYDILPSVTTLGDSKKVLGRASKQLSRDVEMLRDNFGPVEAATDSARQ